MKNISAPIYIYFFITGCFLTSIPCYATDTSGEIINVNPAQNIAFIDLGKDIINKGDIFSVETTSGTVYLEVVETAPAVSKVGICRNTGYKSSSSDLSVVSIGTMAKRVLIVPSTSQSPSLQEAMESKPSSAVGIPNIDPQVLVKPNIANESIQSLDTRLDKMVESNVKLFNSLTELLNEKKQWQNETDVVRTQLQTAHSQIQALNLANIDLKKQLADANYQAANFAAENAKHKKMFDDAQFRLQGLKEKLDNLNKVIKERLRQ